MSVHIRTRYKQEYIYIGLGNYDVYSKTGEKLYCLWVEVHEKGVVTFIWSDGEKRVLLIYFSNAKPSSFA